MISVTNRLWLRGAALVLAFSLSSGAAALARPQPQAQPQAQATAVPLALDDAIALALKRNLQYREAQVAVESAQAQLQQSRAPELPGVAVRDDYQYVNPVAKLSTPFGTLPFSTVSATNVPLVALQYTLYDGGLTAARVGQAVAGVAAAEASEREARGAVIARVTTAYYGVAAAIEMSAVASRAVAVAGAHVKEARELLAAGMIPRADLLRAQAEQANEQVNQIVAANGVNLAQTSLDIVLDVPLATVYRPTDALSAPAPSFDLKALLASARVQRGELVAARAAVTVARAAIAEARSGYRPHVGVTVADGDVQPAVTGGYHNQFSVGLNAVWTLFDHGYTAGRVAQARAGVKRARLGVLDLENSIDLQVRQAYLNVRESSARVEAAKRLVVLADENLRLAQVRYRGGVSTALELQDAELGDRSARQTLVGAQAALRRNVVQLRFAAGLL